jgi:hypothetical protein
MPVLSGSVGSGGDNRKHDVANVQAALMVAKNPVARPIGRVKSTAKRASVWRGL